MRVHGRLIFLAFLCISLSKMFQKEKTLHYPALIDCPSLIILRVLPKSTPRHFYSLQEGCRPSSGPTWRNSSSWSVGLSDSLPSVRKQTQILMRYCLSSTRTVVCLIRHKQAYNFFQNLSKREEKTFSKKNFYATFLRCLTENTVCNHLSQSSFQCDRRLHVDDRAIL